MLGDVLIIFLFCSDLVLYDLVQQVKTKTTVFWDSMTCCSRCCNGISGNEGHLQSFWCVLWSAKSNNGVTGSRKGSELMWTRVNDVNDFTVNIRNGVKTHCILEAEGLPEPLSLGITTNGIRCAGCWTILKCRQFLRFFSLHLLCARSKVSQTHARCVDLVRLKRFLPQMRAAGLTNINLSAAPTPDKTRNPIWIWESSIFYHVYCSVTWLFFRVNVCKLCGNVVSAEVRLWANLSLWDLGGNGWVTPAALADGFTEVWTPWNLQSSPFWPDGLWNGMLGDREREEERKKEDIWISWRKRICTDTLYVSWCLWLFSH